MGNHDVGLGAAIACVGLTSEHLGSFASRCGIGADFTEFPRENCAVGNRGQVVGGTGPGHLNATFGSLLRSLRVEAQLTLGQVADAVGVAKPSVWAWENGKARPKRDKWRAIAKILGVAPQVLVAAARTDALDRAASIVLQAENIDRAGMLAAGREMIAVAYGVGPSAVRITVEI